MHFATTISNATWRGRSNVITKISGNLLRLDDDSATVEVEAFEYQVFIAESTRRAVQGQVGQPISLHTIYYLDGDPSRGRVTPRLVGFLPLTPTCKISRSGPIWGGVFAMRSWRLLVINW